jgi:hypothetical protein
MNFKTFRDSALQLFQHGRCFREVTRIILRDRCLEVEIKPWILCPMGGRKRH